MPIIFSILQERPRVARMKKDTVKVCGRSITELKFPEINRKYIRKASRYFRDERVMLPDDFSDLELVRREGMFPVDVRELKYRLADILCESMVKKLGVDAQNTTIEICGKIPNEQILFELTKDKGDVILNCINAQKLQKSLLAEYGIASGKNENTLRRDVNIRVNFEANNFFLHIKIGAITYTADILIELPERFFGIPKTHVKSAAVAFLQSGELNPKEIRVDVECRAI